MVSNKYAAMSFNSHKLNWPVFSERKAAICLILDFILYIPDSIPVFFTFLSEKYLFLKSDKFFSTFSIEGAVIFFDKNLLPEIDSGTANINPRVINVK